MKGIKILAMLVVLASLASCGIFKTKSKQTNKIEVSESSKVETTSGEISSVIDEGKTKEVDQGVIVTEKETTTVTEKPSSKVKVTAKKEDLKHGENFLKDSAGQLVIAILDTLNKTLSIEFEQKGERITKTEKERSIEQKNKSTDKEEKKQESTQKQTAIVSQQERKEEKKDTITESKPSIMGMLWFWIGGGIFVVIVGIAIALWLGFRPKKA